ncbi:MAG TPA: LPS export ABC transporter permease LptF [Rhodospirillaceae bacterium]|nr:LPS export ABC transporter permease LptF [Candidatus Neomarinimicrobiota bacterium]HCX14028.1 LPS export ABC transporter permease LptF [Rhodospirillaceae bacterium]
MSGITSYIFRQLIIGAIMVSIALAFIVWLTQSLQFLQFVISKGLDIGTWLKLTTLLLPWFLSVILPMSLFFVVLFVYNKLSLDRELVVVQSAGISLLGVAFPALLSAVMVTFVGYSLTLFAVPETFRSFKELQWSIRNDVSQILLREGAFNQLAKELMVYIRAQGQNGELHGILVHDTRNAPDNVTFMAERGMIISTNGKPAILLTNGSRQELEQESRELSVLYFDSYSLDFGSLSRTTEDRFADNRERNTLELLNISEEDGISAINVSRMKAEAHQRIASPLTSIGYTAMALVFLLRGTFDRRGQAGRIIAAILTVVILQAAGLGANNLASQSTSFIFLLYLIAIMPIIAGLVVLNMPRWQVPQQLVPPLGAGAA